MYPQPRPLRLDTPHLHGRDVAAVQRLLGVDADGDYGPLTARAVADWKRSRGDPEPNEELTLADRRRLLADVLLRATRTMERWAAAGLHEEPRSSNRVPALIELASRLEVAPSFRGMGFPWCSFAVFLAALAAGGRSAAAGLRAQAFNPLYAPAVLDAAREGSFGLRVVRLDEAARGDIVLFDWSPTSGDPADHVARLVRRPAAGRVRTVDGNAGGDGLVALRDRPLTEVRAFVRDS